MGLPRTFYGVDIFQDGTLRVGVGASSGARGGSGKRRYPLLHPNPAPEPAPTSFSFSMKLSSGLHQS